MKKTTVSTITLEFTEEEYSRLQEIVKAWYSEFGSLISSDRLRGVANEIMEFE